jgi:hypothetical protein|tara:strand:+ start:224 stop:496 length:273 start_codon:yes stop_codon:yes gene_type:complete
MKKIKYIENGVTKTFTKEQVTNKVIKIEEVLRKLGGWVKISVLVKQSNLELKFIKKILIILHDNHKVELEYGQGWFNCSTLYGVEQVKIK